MSPYREKIQGPDALAPRRVRRWLIEGSLAVAGCWFLVAATVDFVGGSSARRWTFVSPTNAVEGLDFELALDRAGSWTTEPDARATGARSLVNWPAEPTAPSSIVVADFASRSHLRVATRCRARAAFPSQSCGLSFRVVDQQNYYFAEVDAIADEVRVGVVDGGKERTLGRSPAPISPDEWHEIGVETGGSSVRVTLNAEPILTLEDASLPTRGRAGLRSPAGASTHFDELSIESL